MIIKTIQIIHLNYNENHSGITLGYTMRHLQFIARYGLKDYKRMVDSMQ